MRHGAEFSTGLVSAAADDDNREELLARLEERGRAAVESLVLNSGPYLTVDEANERLGMSKSDIHDAVEANDIIGLGAPYFPELRLPEWQFVDGTPVTGLSEVLHELAPGDVTEALLFMQAPLPQFEGKTPLDLLKMGKAAAAVRLASRLGEHGGR